MKSYLFLSAFLLTSCAPVASHIKHLGPLPEASQTPASCKIVGVLPDSPASKAGLRTGEVVRSVNGTTPADALAVSDLIDQAPADTTLDVSGADNKVRTLKITLNKDRPRLGASCDLTGWRKNSVSAAGNESVTVFNGPFALTASGIFDKGLAFMRIRISNHSDHALPVTLAVFTVSDGNRAPVNVLTPQEVIFFMHGDDAVPFVKSPAGESLSVPADSPVRRAGTSHKKKADWSRSDESYVKANADYLHKESLWTSTIEPGKTSDGLIYFIEPKVLPVTVDARIEGALLSVRFGEPKPSTQVLSTDDLAHFFETQKKGTAVRLTLKKGKVFVGKYSSYDPINEIVWFDTPSGVLLTTSSFGLKYIAYAEAIAPEPDKKQPVPEPLN